MEDVKRKKGELLGSFPNAVFFSNLPKYLSEKGDILSRVPRLCGVLFSCKLYVSKGDRATSL